MKAHTHGEGRDYILIGHIIMSPEPGAADVTLSLGMVSKIAVILSINCASVVLAP